MRASQVWDASIQNCGAVELPPIRDIVAHENIFNDYYHYDSNIEMQEEKELFKRCWLFNAREELMIGGENFRHRALRAFFILGVAANGDEPPPPLDAAELYVFPGKHTPRQIVQ